MQQLKADVQARTPRDSYELDGKQRTSQLGRFGSWLPTYRCWPNSRILSGYQMGQEQLSLRNNAITALPGTLVMLKGLQELDLAENPLDDVHQLKNMQLQATVAVLKGLPQLKQLCLAVSKREDEQLIVRNLPALQFLNGKGTVFLIKTSAGMKV